MVYLSLEDPSDKHDYSPLLPLVSQIQRNITNFHIWLPLKTQSK